jgi:hypothetical protein
MTGVEAADVERWLDLLYIAAEGAGLRSEDRRKAVEVSALLEEVAREVARRSRRTPIVLVDAAAGKSYVGLLAAKLVLEPARPSASVITLEHDALRVEASRLAAERLGCRVAIDCRDADVADARAWPESPTIVTALHACGPAADTIVERAAAARARTILLVPCCTSRAVEAAARAERRAATLAIPPHAPVRRRFIQAMVDAERTWRLEAAGYETEVVEFVPPTVTPHNLLWRSRLVGEPVRMAAAARALERLRSM